MNREAVESFVTAARLGTISAAAKELYASQSTVSHRIQVLEQELGVTLLERQRGMKRVILTAEGSRFLELAVQWLEVERHMYQVRSHPTMGQITIGSMDSINQYLLADVVRQLREELPGLQMSFVSYHSQELYSRLSTRQLDIGIAFFPIHYDIAATPVFSEPMYMISPVGSDYPAGTIYPTDLKKSDQIYFAWDSHTAAWNREWWSDGEAPYVSVDSCALLTTFLTRPKSWAICPASVAEALRRQGVVELRQFGVPAPRRTCYLLRRKPNTNGYSQGMEQFIQRFFQLIQNNPWRYTGEPHGKAWQPGTVPLTGDGTQC